MWKIALQRYDMSIWGSEKGRELLSPEVGSFRDGRKKKSFNLKELELHGLGNGRRLQGTEGGNCQAGNNGATRIRKDEFDAAGREGLDVHFGFWCLDK